MDKCLWGNLRTRLSFEDKLTVDKILKIAEELENSFPAGKDMRFKKPGNDLYKTFPKAGSLHSEVTHLKLSYNSWRKLIRQRSRSIFKGFLENESFDHYEFVSRV